MNHEIKFSDDEYTNAACGAEHFTEKAMEAVGKMLAGGWTQEKGDAMKALIQARERVSAEYHRRESAMKEISK